MNPAVFLPGYVSYGKRGGRTLTTHSKLADPSSPAYAAASQFQEFMYLPDPLPLYVMAGALAGNMISGNPVWLMLVGSSGCGKTMLLKSVMGLSHTVMVSSIKGEAALLSGVAKKDRAKDATGGLLRQIGDHGALVFMDLTTLLSKNKEQANELVSALREIYDGTYSREIGGEGGKQLRYAGRPGLLAGVTHAIDRHHDKIGEMGERCLYFRFPETEGYMECISAANIINPQTNENALRELLAGMFVGAGLSFDKIAERRKLHGWENHRIVKIAQFGARCRTFVPRDYNRQVMDVVVGEVATRMSQELTQLYLGMEWLGVDAEDRWRAIGRVVGDSMTLARSRVLKAVADGIGDGSKIARAIHTSESAARRPIEDLELLGVIERDSGEWVVSEWTKTRMSEVLGITENDETETIK